MSKTSVLIVGAGPTGLATACLLRGLGVEVTVVDAAAEAGRGSRAILLWPPVQEVLDDLGLLERARAEAVVPAALTYHTSATQQARVPLGEGLSPLCLPQERTSELLEETLRERGGVLERSLTLTKLDAGGEAGGDAVTAVFTAADGTERVIEADWLIGADGFRSTVREQLGTPFDGTPVPITFLLAEGTVDGRVDHTEVHYYLSPTGVLLIAPLPGGEVRISTAISEGQEATPELVQAMLDERGPGGLTVAGLRMVTTFVSHERIAGVLRTGRCFLVGDAAHVHSPIGGQGLNLGLQDARNLAWKLAGVIHGTLDPGVLDTYDPERRAAAQQVLAATRKMARQVVSSPLRIKIRNLTWLLLTRTGILAKVYAPLLAGWRATYPDLLAGGSGKGLPAAGSRSPQWPARTDAGGRLHLVTMGALADAGRALAERFPAVLDHEHRTGPDGFVLVRPDGFTAASGTDPATATALLDRLTAGAQAPGA